MRSEDFSRDVKYISTNRTGDKEMGGEKSTVKDMHDCLCLPHTVTLCHKQMTFLKSLTTPSTMPPPLPSGPTCSLGALVSPILIYEANLFDMDLFMTFSLSFGFLRTQSNT